MNRLPLFFEIFLKAILPFVLGGLSFHFVWGSHSVYLELKKEVAALKEEIKKSSIETNKNISSLAGMGFPLPQEPKGKKQ